MGHSQAGEQTSIDDAANRFEHDWKRGGDRPRIEDFLAQDAGPRRSLLLQALLRVECELREIAAETPSREEYRQRFPDDLAAIDAVFGHEAPVDPPPRPSGDAAQSLLFGLLALQNNFIDRDNLLAAFNAWIADKSLSLGQVLLDRGAISPARHAVLQTLVREHLHQHGFDPERSLSVLSIIPSVLDRLEKLPDLDFQASLLYLRLANTDDNETDENDAEDESTADWDDERAATDAEGRFRIVRFHDRGGLGEVYVARDQQLHRIVALKRIKRDHSADKDKRARFVVEAEITGRLEHPGIVPVYGLGTYDDGRPFYAMRFIRGNNLKTAIEQFHQAEEKSRDPGERALALLKLLRRFLDVCNAIDYAHSRGVLHRDLKPGNIMLGKFGETLVVDWGLAKSVGRPEDAPASATMDDRTLVPHSGSDLHGTALGAKLGTPAYMSPEQAAGRIADLGRASDVYSLGATLYCLLTGRAPVDDKDIAELLRKVERGDFPHPRRLKGWVDPALQAICLKAMATDPTGRYTTPRALADDLEHWLADEPVTAWREPRTRGLLRAVKRHRTAVVGVGAAMLAALVGLAAVSAVQATANGRLTLANQALRTANIELSAAKEALSRSNGELKASGDREHERFSLAIKAIKLFHDEVSQDLLLKEKEFEKLRTKLLRGAAGFYSELQGLLRSQSDLASRAELARAYEELAELTAKIGAKAEALDVWRKGISLRRDLAARSGLGGEASLALARGLIAGAVLQEQVGDKAGALATLEEARALVEGPVALGPLAAESRAALGQALRRSASLLWYRGQRDDGQARLKRARAIFESLALADPAAVRHQVELAECHDTLRDWLGGANHERPADSLRAGERALSIWKQLADAHPEEADHQAALANCLRHIAFELDILGRGHEAFKRLEEARAVWRRLVNANPAVMSFQSNEAFVLNSMGISLQNSGKNAEAVPIYREAISKLQKLVGARPEDVRCQITLGYTHNNIGLSLVAVGDLIAALDQFRRGAAVFQDLADAHPGEPRYRNDQIYRQLWMSDVLRKLGRPAEAVAVARRSLELAQKIGETNPEPELLPSGLCSLAQSLGELGETAAAIDAARRAVGLVDKLPRDSADQCINSGTCHVTLWTVAGGAGSGVSEAEREIAAGAAIAMFSRAVELGYKRSEAYTEGSLLIPSSFRKREDFRLFLMDLSMPDDPFVPR